MINNHDNTDNNDKQDDIVHNKLNADNANHENNDVNDNKDIESKIFYEGKNVLDAMFANYNLTLDTTTIQKGNDNWYQHCGILFRKLAKDEHILQEDTEKERLEILEQLLIQIMIGMIIKNIHLKMLCKSLWVCL